MAPLCVPFALKNPHEVLVVVTSPMTSILEKYDVLYRMPSFIALQTENLGADILPFLIVLVYLEQHEVTYEKLLKLHSKSNEIILNRSLTFLLDSDKMKSIFETNEHVGMIGQHILHMSDVDAINRKKILHCFDTLNTPKNMVISTMFPLHHSQYLQEFDKDYFIKRHPKYKGSQRSFFIDQKRTFLGWNPKCPQFIEATLFWIRGVIAQTLCTYLTKETLQLLRHPYRKKTDGDIPHAWERMFGLMTQLLGYQLFDEIEWNHAMKTLDVSFYMHFYPDIRHVQQRHLSLTFEQYAHRHWKNHGQRERRIPNLYHLHWIQSSHQRLLREQFDRTLPHPDAPLVDIPFYVLVRTCHRPHLFRQCMQSVVNQDYIYSSNIHIHVSYDCNEALDTIQEYQRQHKELSIHTIHVSADKSQPLFYNLYCNTLLESVKHKNAWIMFIDDDEQFCDVRAFSLICSYIATKGVQSFNTIFMWNFMRSDKIIFPSNVNHIQIGDMDTSSFCFHSTLLTNDDVATNTPTWEARRHGDYHFLQQLLNHSVRQTTCEWIPYILTSSIQQDRIGNFGASTIL